MSEAMSNYAHWPDCALNHGYDKCDMGPECGCRCLFSGDVMWAWQSDCPIHRDPPRAAPQPSAQDKEPDHGG